MTYINYNYRLRTRYEILRRFCEVVDSQGISHTVQHDKATILHVVVSVLFEEGSETPTYISMHDNGTRIEIYFDNKVQVYIDLTTEIIGVIIGR